MFDIRDLKVKTSSAQGTGDNREYWTVAFLKKVDSFFPKINDECAALNLGKNERTGDAFTNKIEAWFEFVTALQKLCRLYKIKDALCLSRKN